MATAENNNEELKKMSKTGFASRTIGWTLLFVAATVAVVFGMRHGIAYASTLPLDANLQSYLQYAIALVGYIAAGFVAIKTSNAIEKAYHAMTTGMVQEAKATPAPAAA